ncbi:PREDICTED: uncharacterized protein C17orf74 homolog [Elephantulus edwardii]|uniref:uncharacterized protein C17orf74 homolog n=1 Tax=Elephantulus edwardii TaxID=28737 RepID=UPI0003F0CBC6|nr:PREDICTED: uncharacterized protein C17orf74 homolog [Elephantulus edwardii]
MEGQLLYDPLGCCSQHQDSSQDAEDFLLLLLGLIIIVNTGVNMATVLWHWLQNTLAKMTCWINQKNDIIQSCHISPKDPCQSSARDIHVRCTLDPVEDSFPDEDLSFLQPKDLRERWGGFCPRPHLPSNLGLWGRQGGILASLPLPSFYMSPELRRLPKRVEAKSELRLQTYGPCFSQSHVWSNVEAEHRTSPLQPARRLPLNPSWGPGEHSPQPSRGHLLHESWEQRRHGLEGTEAPPALVPRCSIRPEVQACRDHCSPQTHRRGLTSYSHSQPNRSPHPSTGHLTHSSRDRHEVRRRAAECAEAMPTRHPLTTSASLTILGEASCQRGPAPASTLLHHCSQPLPVVQVVDPPPPIFIPLSRSPGAKANQVYDSLELKRQVLESQAQTTSLPPCASDSRPPLHRSRTGKLS